MLADRWTLRSLGVAAAVSASASSAGAQFLDRTAAAGLTYHGESRGAIFVDLDGDGHLDLYAGHHTLLPVLYRNDGTGSFAPLPFSWTGAADRHGALIVSLDSDANPEILVIHGGQGGMGQEPNELYRNDGGGGFTDIAAAAGVDDPSGRGRSAAAADYDGDFRTDVWVGKAFRAGHPNSLYRNDGALAFTDVAAAAGLDEDRAVGGLWGDLDEDGDPDLLVGGEEGSRPTSWFRNDGGAFVDVSAMFVPPLPVVSAADLGDLDNDGDLDVVVCDGGIGVFDTFAEGDTVTFYFDGRYGEDGVDGLTIPSTADTLYAELEIGDIFEFVSIFLGPDELEAGYPLPLTLTDDYVGAPPFEPGVERGIWVWRTSAGGPWELRCSSLPGTSEEFHGWLADGSPITGTVGHDLEDPMFVPGGPRVWRNDGNTFVETTAELGLPTMLNPRDVSWVDYDSDGDLDLHVVDMGTTAQPNAPDKLFRNDGTVFTDVTAQEGVAGSAVGMGDGAVWGDADRDGDLDLFLLEGTGPGAFSELGPALFLENAAARGHAILVDLVGNDSGTAAIGSRVTARVAERVVRRRVSANSWRGFCDPLRVHVGLGEEAAADSLVVEWPAGNVDVYTSVPAGTYRLNERRSVVALDILAATPDSVPPGQIETVHFEVRSVSGLRAGGEAPNFVLRSLGGLLTPQGFAVENADSTYTFSYLSAPNAGADTVVVTDPLSDPPLADSLTIAIVTPTAASPDGGSRLPSFSLEAPWPNPFEGGCRIEFSLPRGGAARLVVYDVGGRRVRVLRSGILEAGRHSSTWDGVDAKGEAVRPGVYFVELEYEGERSARKLVRIPGGP